MLKTEPYFAILLMLLILVVIVIVSRMSSASYQLQRWFTIGFLFVNSTARLIAAIMLSGRAMPFPAISNAVPWSGLVRGNGRPSVTFTPAWNACSFNGINA